MDVGNEDLLLWNIPNYPQTFVLYHMEFLNFIFKFIAPGFETTTYDKYDVHHVGLEFGLLWCAKGGHSSL
jgi:hypothetical protein